jgi:hypothetical protein
MTAQSNLDPLRMDRRAALQIGTGLFGLHLPGFLQAVRAGAADRDISCLFIFLAGGPSHFESFDPKPDAPPEIRGIWNPTSTSVPGTFICEKMPLMASRMHKVAIVRSWQGKSGSHATGSQHVASGAYPPAGGQHVPNFGCLVSALKGNQVRGVPAHFGLPVATRYTKPSGYLGTVADAFDIKGDPAKPQVKFDGPSLPEDRFEDRQSMLTQLDNLSRLAETESGSIEAHDKFSDEAVALLTSGAMQRAMNLDEESLQTRERYGDNMYGRRVLLGRRLLEAGARFVTINQAVQGGLFGAGTTNGTWDNHHLLFESMMSFEHEPASIPGSYKWHSTKGPGNLPQLDMSLSTVLDDLEDRGMLDTTLVMAMGEFGRTPRINKNAGRDHYPSAGSVLLAGAGISGGAVVGATDRKGAAPKTRPRTPEDFGATIFHALGIDHHRTFFPRITRPTPISDGQVITELFA